ncbi:MAG: hypothetical protein IIA87_02145 [Nanoarchaeota archaeon]|nr:hypothetical protein [Nanoarchaeota archaeon]
MRCLVNCFDMKNKFSGRRGQLKIQQMAFVLVTLMIFFSMVALFYFSIRYSTLRSDVEEIREQEVIETVRKMSGAAEFAWSIEDCASCIDLDKVLVLKERQSYQNFWRRIPFLQVKKIYPVSEEKECTRQNYPDCSTITIVDEDTNIVTHSAFVALCRYEAGENKCELGKIIMGFETIGK